MERSRIRVSSRRAPRRSLLPTPPTVHRSPEEMKIEYVADSSRLRRPLPRPGPDSGGNPYGIMVPKFGRQMRELGTADEHTTTRLGPGGNPYGMAAPCSPDLREDEMVRMMEMMKSNTCWTYDPFTHTTSTRPSTPIDDGVTTRSSLEAIVRDESLRPHDLPLQELKDITDDFSDQRILGQGGFGVVYKGVLRNGDNIAVKRIVSSLMPGQQKQFESEVYHLMMLKHPNIVRCVGYCYEIQNRCLEYNGKYVFAEMAERLICLEYMPKGSLDKYLSDESSELDWSTRYNIIEGICYGLCHLHDKPIIHLDLKPANILLDDRMEPKITDFGLSRQLDQQKTICTSSRDGTFGYMAPEFLHGGTITTKSDIFSLGVIILEVVTGHRDYPDVTRTPSDDFIELTLEKWRNVLQRSPGYESVETDCKQIKRCLEVGLICVNPDRTKRPPMANVIIMLQGRESID